MALRERVDDPAAGRAVLGALRARRGVATRADLVVDTSLPETTVARALEGLLDRYDSAMSVERGTIVYRFAPAFRRRPERRTRLRALLALLAATGQRCARLARTTFRVVLAVQLVTYLAIVLLPVSAVLGALLGVVLLVFGILADVGVWELLQHPTTAAILLALCVLVGIGIVIEKKLELLLGLLGRRQVSAERGRLDGLALAVDAFALGPPARADRGERLDRTWRISQADERRVLARVREASGVLRAGDLVDWLGFTFEEADAQLTRLAVEYGGEPSASPESPVLEVRFPSLLASASGRSTIPPAEPTSVERAEPAAAFTGNAPRQDVWIAAFALANGAAGLLAWRLLEAPAARHWGYALARVAAWPALACSGLLLGLALLRAPFWLQARASNVIRRTRERYVRAIVARVRRGARSLDLAAVEKQALAKAGLLRLSPAEQRAVALALGGEHDVDDVDRPKGTVWRFPRLRAELAAPTA